MATPRCKLVDPNVPLFYHIVSRCVRRGWLCGYDRLTRRDYSHRKQWFVDRINQLGSAFALDVHAYAVMSNHFHLIVHFDPTACRKWEDEEVVQRWLTVCPCRLPDGTIDNAQTAFRRDQLLGDTARLTQIREKLGSLSMFMKFLKQPIARRANLEDNFSGHFFDQRFYSGALLNDAAVLAAMAYVDLNPVRAQVAKSIEQARHASIHERLREASEDASVLDEYLAPLASGLNASVRIKVTLRTYIHRLNSLTTQPAPIETNPKLEKWRDQVVSLKRRQRVFGSTDQIKRWTEARAMQMRESPLPV